MKTSTKVDVQAATSRELAEEQSFVRSIIAAKHSTVAFGDSVDGVALHCIQLC